MNVSAVIVTRGDVDLAPVLDSLPRDWEKVVYDNSVREDLAVYGRYAAIEDCEHDLIYVQDDDCVLPPESLAALVEQWQVSSWGGTNYLVANMPERFRHDFYTDHCLVGFGALFHRALPDAAFDVIVQHDGLFADHGFDVLSPLFERTCDIAFTALTPCILVDLPYRDLPHAHADNRMWKQPQHQSERTEMLRLVREVRDAR